MFSTFQAKVSFLFLSISSVDQSFSSVYLAFSARIKNLPAGSFMFKVNKRNTRTRWEIC